MLLMKKLLRLAATALVASSAAAQNAPIVVHHIGPFTGVLAASNKESIDGANLFLEGFNARGGVQGRPVKLETLDDGQDPKRAKALLDELLKKKPLALLLPRTTPSMEAMLPGVTQSGTPVVGPQTGGSFVNSPPRREVFTLRASYQKEAETAIRMQHGIGVASFGVLLADDVFGTDTMIAIDKTFKELKLTPLAVAKIDNRKPDVTGPVDTMLAKAPQVVLLIVSSKAASDFVKRYREKGGSATFISLSNTSNNDYIQGLGDQARGAIVMQVMPSPFSGGTPLARDYANAAAKQKLPLSYAGLYGFASAKLLALGLQRTGPQPTPASLIAALEGMGEIDLGGFRVRYGPNDRVGSTFVDSAIITVGGKFLR
jgi:branched-chain amino acid transport system substrate-binding protein